MLFRGFQCLFLGCVMLLGGCAVANYVVDPYTNIRFEAEENINPDRSDRPSPLVVKIYELESVETFNSADFFDLYDEPQAILEDDLLSLSEVVVRPGLVHVHPMTLDSKARYIGIVAAFQNISEARWKLVVDATPKGYKTLKIAVDGLKLDRVIN